MPVVRSPRHTRRGLPRRSPRRPDGPTARRALGTVLRALREAHPDEPSQERVGEWADLHRNYVGSAERGQRNVAFEALSRWLVALGVSWADFGAAVDQALAKESVATAAPATRRVADARDS